MAATGETRASAPPSNDWPAQIADTVARVVGTVRDKTAIPLETVARALVYGILIAVLGLTALVTFTIMLVRVLDLVLPIWGVYLLLGGLFTALGAFLLFAKTHPKGAA